MEAKEEQSTTKKVRPYRWLRRMLRVFAGVVLVLCCLVLFIRSEWGQGIIVSKAVDYVKSKTGTEVAVEKLFVTFDGHIQLDGVYLEDKKQDTLLYSKSLETSIPLWSILSGGPISIDYAKWDGLKARVSRKDTVSGFNYEFLVDAFVSTDTTTVSEPLDLKLGNMEFSNFDIIYKDDVSGMDASVLFKKLDVEMDHIDLDNMQYAVDRVLLENAKLRVVQNAVPVENDAVIKETNLPDAIIDKANDSPDLKLILNQLNFNDVVIDYESAGDGIKAYMDLGSLDTSIPLVNLGTNTFNIEHFKLGQSNITINLRQETTGIVEPVVFEWPPFDVTLDELAIANTNFNYSLNNAIAAKGAFNPNAVAISNINTTITAFKLKDKTASVVINELSGYEKSGIAVRKLEVILSATDTDINVKNLDALVNNSSLRGNTSLSFESLNGFINDPTNFNINTNLDSFAVDMNDVLLFNPALNNNPYIAALKKRLLTGSLVANGSTAAMNLESARVNWGSTTQLNAQGSLSNLMNPDALTYNFNHVNARSTRADLLNFVSEKDLSIKLPAAILMDGTLAGSTTRVDTDMVVRTSQGTINANAFVNMGDAVAFDINAKAREIDLGYIMQNDLGKITLELDAKGSGSDVKTLDAIFDATINKFEFNDYAIRELPISGAMKNGKGTVTSNYRDDNIDILLDGIVDLSGEQTTGSATIDLKGMDLSAFGLTSQHVKAGAIIEASFAGDAAAYKVQSKIKDGIAIYDDQSYLLGSVNIDALVKPDTTSVSFKNRILELQLESNTSPLGLSEALQRHVERYLTTNTSIDTTSSVVMNLKGIVRTDPLLRDVLLPRLEALDTVAIAMNFNEKARKLDTDIVLPRLQYAGSEIDSLVVRSRSDATNFSFNVGFKRVAAGPVQMDRTLLTGALQNSVLNLDFTSYNGNERYMHFGSTLSRKRTTNDLEDLIITILPDDLVLGGEKWTVPNQSEIAIGDNRLNFKDVLFTNGNQRLAINNGVENALDAATLDFNGFKLENLVGLLNPKKLLASGTMNGSVAFRNVFSELGFTADLDITDFAAMDTPLGTLTLDAETSNSKNYEMEMAINGSQVDLSLGGTYTASVNDALLDMELDIDKIAMETLSGLSLGYIKDGTGYIAGNISIKGTTVAPTYDGDISFNNTSFNVAMLDAIFKINNESVGLSNEAIAFNNFEIKDFNNNSFFIDGSVGTESLTNPTFNLKMNAVDFTALNSTEEDNDLYYGRATFDVDATITGNLEIPVVDVQLSVDKETDVYYVMPATELDIVSRDGIVQFVNKENPDDILTRTEEETATLTGFDINMSIKVNREAVVNIIVDPATGDNLRVAGAGDLIFTMNPNGRMTLTGRYEIEEGHYELSLYNIVSRRFEIAKGSSVSWKGDPFDASLDVSAIYKVETSASALMSSQTSGSDLATQSKFRQVLPFLVYLNVDGELLAPVISFKIDIPEDEQGAIGGQVYGRVQQLNSQEQELNKQVFSLLVLNKFFPTSGSDGSSGGTAAIARDNLNQALSDQLNQFGGKLLGGTGVDLNFGLDSFTDYQGADAQERTQLDITASKKLLDDRLIVSVGSEVDIQGSAQDSGAETPVIGNLSLEYLINESGVWRFKGFRKNQYDNVVDGQLVVSGIGLIFNREFNEFSNLFTKTEVEKALAEELKQKKQAQKEAEKRKAQEEKERKQREKNGASTNAIITEQEEND